MNPARHQESLGSPKSWYDIQAATIAFGAEDKRAAISLGDQLGCVSEAGDFVTLTASPLVTGCTQMSKLPLRSEAYAIKRPSGENVGSV